VVATAFTDPQIDEIGWRRLGLRVRESKRPNAIVIAKVRRRSHAARAGIEPGDLLLAVEQEACDSLAAFRRAVVTLRDSEPVSIMVRRGNATYRVALPGDE